jgi:hypothetical protein
VSATALSRSSSSTPEPTCDERQAEIQRLRYEYGFSAMPPEQSRKLIELPEPDTAQKQAEREPLGEVALAA